MAYTGLGALAGVSASAGMMGKPVKVKVITPSSTTTEQMTVTNVSPGGTGRCQEGSEAVTVTLSNGLSSFACWAVPAGSDGTNFNLYATVMKDYGGPAYISGFAITWYLVPGMTTTESAPAPAPVTLTPPEWTRTVDLSKSVLAPGWPTGSKLHSIQWERYAGDPPVMRVQGTVTQVSADGRQSIRGFINVMPQPTAGQTVFGVVYPTGSTTPVGIWLGESAAAAVPVSSSGAWSPSPSVVAIAPTVPAPALSRADTFDRPVLQMPDGSVVSERTTGGNGVAGFLADVPPGALLLGGVAALLLLGGGKKRRGRR